ncbi:hypothetical protein BbuMM1_D070 (plasmid) [Borreliella burgdorferi]|nr:hypothetical protein BbuMM1_D070 [Borreliella burgdorferi]
MPIINSIKSFKNFILLINIINCNLFNKGNGLEHINTFDYYQK